MTRLLLLLCACLAAICEAALLAPPAFSSRQSLAGRAPSTRASLVERLRGGAADEDEDEDEDGDELDEELEGGGEEVAVDDDGPSLANPFLGGGGGAGEPPARAGRIGRGLCGWPKLTHARCAGGLGGLSEITKSLQDPATLQKALKELQDPATQALCQPVAVVEREAEPPSHLGPFAAAGAVQADDGGPGLPRVDEGLRRATHQGPHV